MKYLIKTSGNLDRQRIHYLGDDGLSAYCGRSVIAGCNGWQIVEKELVSSFDICEYCKRKRLKADNPPKLVKEQLAATCHRRDLEKLARWQEMSRES